MKELQLEFNLDNKTPYEVKISQLENQVYEISTSLGKVRRRLFSELGQMKKLYLELQKENQELKNILQDREHEPTQWRYAENDYLFDIQEHNKAL